MRKVNALLAAASAMALMAGCSTVIDGADQPVLVSTTGTDNARCEVEDRSGRVTYVESTPGSVQVERGDGPLTVECTKDGYRTGTTAVPEEFNWWTVGNVVGLLGFGVDFYTGAYQKYPNRVDVPMVSLQAGSAEDADRRSRMLGQLEVPPDSNMQTRLDQPAQAGWGGADQGGRAPDGSRMSMQIGSDGPVLSRHLPVFDEQTALTAELPPPFPGESPTVPQNTLLASDLGPSGAAGAPPPPASDGMAAPSDSMSAPSSPTPGATGVATVRVPPAGTQPRTTPTMAPAAAAPSGSAAAGAGTARTPAAMPSGPSGAYSVQIGAFRDGTNASRLVSRLRPKGYNVDVIREVDRRGLPWHYVRFGSFGSRSAALTEAQRFRSREGMSAIPVSN